MRREKLFIFCFLLMLIFPVCGHYADKYVSLNGVTETTELSHPSISNVLDGTFQENFGTYIENHFGGRNLLIKMRSQLLYSGFNSSPNKNVVIGKKQYLFEPEYIYKELNIYPPAGDDYFDELISKLESLQSLCKENGKELYIFVTPSKAFFCKDMIPEKYYSLGNDGENNYQRFIRHIKDSDLKFFDSHDYICNHEDEIEAPIFYSTGIHWSHPWGNKCAIELADLITASGKYNLGTIAQKVKKKKNNEPTNPDSDLYDSLNLFVKPDNDDYYKSKIKLEGESSCPNVFLRGGSFMGQSLGALGRAGVWNTTAHFENNYCFINNYSETITLSGFDAYSEFDNIGEYLGKSDIIILEVNEAATPNMSWEFIDYLLENSQLLQ
ncbi:alginate O-acetyltransferase AlgX-related protein [Butyrivibrio sp. NC2002]|uniref:alginate O-acetyltransferase AlgX-related protein n=1 Tax=Butyrivibrio sp. NC2002 TaxID=1410610 RepID=UPI00055E252E|nr:hypothetical protein [Butyrivibrio sp. NC2002]